MISWRRSIPTAPPALPNGLAFEIADLMLAVSWAERYKLRVIVRCDHGATVYEDYEEVIAF